ncbi:trypsinogen-like protein 3 [Salarias fasciatus]|uniref:Trypsinogen-like protein 3 n=1 Tax=Salarias fasciatus TaxID=181472 RepID=A0A672FFV4_SALFA|nr:trypsinogen-like protein 3 [Salarias fasciatus]
MKLLLAVLLGLAGAAPLEDSKECQPHSRPWQVYLDRPSCSGALIDQWWVVTSFDCAPTPYSTVATLGDHDLSSEEGGEQRALVAEVIRHSPYRSALHSLTLVRLAEPARFTPHVQPVALPSRCPKPGETCSVSGWGSTVPNQYGRTDRLQCITVPIVDDQTCVETFPPYIYWGVMVCAGQENTDNCLRDQGSLMVCDGQLQGVHWFGHGCQNPAHPTVYSKLCEYGDWIHSTISSHSPSLPTTTTTTTPSF